MRERQAVMGLLGAKGGPRNWQVAGMYLDLLGPVESFARTPFRRGDGQRGGTTERLNQPRGAHGQILQNQRRQRPLAASILEWLGNGHDLCVIPAISPEQTDGF
jgi:hypothetical protein